MADSNYAQYGAVNASVMAVREMYCSNAEMEL